MNVCDFALYKRTRILLKSFLIRTNEEDVTHDNRLILLVICRLYTLSHPSAELVLVQHFFRKLNDAVEHGFIMYDDDLPKFVLCA